MKITDKHENPNIPQPDKITMDMLVSVPGFVKELSEKFKDKKINVQGIYYQLEHADNLDWIEFYGVKYIYKNQKYENFVPGNNYKRISTTQF